MPAFTFTADSSTDIITIVGHGLLTGDGPACVRNVGGALPGGLVAQTDYWAIRLGPDTLRLATSSGNAMAGIYINITANGSGTNLLEVGIPYRRPRTYIPGVSQIDAGDLNANFDAWKNLHALLTAQPQSVWSGISLMGSLKASDVRTTLGAWDRTSAVAGFGTATSSVNATTGEIGVTFSADNQTWSVPFQVRSGSRVLAFSITAATTAGTSATLVARLWKYSAGSIAAPTQIGGNLTHTDVEGDVEVAIGSPSALVDGDCVHMTILCTVSSGNPVLLHCGIKTDRP